MNKKMTLSDIADMDDYLENRCYYPYEIYDMSGFFFRYLNLRQNVDV